MTQNDLENYKANATPYTYPYVIHETQTSICFTLRPCVLQLQSIINKCIECARNALEHYNVKGTHVLLDSLSPNFTPRRSI